MNYIASWAGEIIQRGQFQATKEALTTLVTCCKFQKNCFELWFCIDLFYDLIHGGGADNSNGINFEHHRKLLSL